jgi:hypothetical protein
MGFITTGFKLLLSITFDVTDFFIGRIPVWGTVFDILGGLFAIALWGKLGSLQFAEIIDITDQIDAFIPTVTIAGIITILQDR